VPVVEDLRLTGILTEADFVRYLTDGERSAQHEDAP
jgi:CBS domain-containing protein